MMSARTTGFIRRSISLALLATLVEVTGCIADDELDGPLGEAQESIAAVTPSLWGCTSVDATVFTHVFAGRAVSCGVGVYCAVGSGQQIGTVLTIGDVRVSQTNPGYYVAGSCLGPTSFQWPLAGANGSAWVINNYVDLDTDPGDLRDYAGGQKTYDGHQGEDICIASFRTMDKGIPVLAAASGTVIETHDGEFDRNTSCTGNANYVKVRHANGSEAWYWHMRNGSVAVSTGAHVNAGTKLGEVGSSGCSTDPHLHFEVHEYNGTLLDPFRDNMFASPPAYSASVHLLDVAMMLGHVSDAAAKSPGMNANLLNIGAQFSTVMYTGNGLAGQTLAVQIMGPNGKQWNRSADITLTGTERQRRFRWWWTLGNTRGDYVVRFLVNGSVAKTLTFTAG
ncbi:MAG: M23 family metallopeptidase [Deltaproteobacteria bacterium]|nr:M23 family metallopeptidase [Deltaproteobacteria bacterium]